MRASFSRFPTAGTGTTKGRGASTHPGDVWHLVGEDGAEKEQRHAGHHAPSTDEGVRLHRAPAQPRRQGAAHRDTHYARQRRDAPEDGVHPGPPHEKEQHSTISLLYLIPISEKGKTGILKRSTPSQNETRKNRLDTRIEPEL